METRKPSNKQPKPVSQDTGTEPDIQARIAKRMKAMRDAKELKQKTQIQALIAQAM